MSDVAGQEGGPQRPEAARPPGAPPPAALHGQAAAPPRTGHADPAGEAGTAGGDTIAQLQARVAELDDRWRRALADADNMRKRQARELEKLSREERARVAQEWLPVLDSLDRALEHADSDPGAVIDGVRAVRDQALDVLARLGYPRREDLGQPFDPARHDAAGIRQPADAPPGTVVEVVRPGYGDGEHQLRPALVVVAQGG
jgi:molecular chaperone GrpE